MEHQRELFKANGSVLCPRNHKSLNGKLQQANRAEKRKNIYNQTRNISTSPQLDDLKVKTAVSLTSRVKNHELPISNEIKENNDPKTITETIQSNETVSEHKAEKKVSRHEAHIQRFLAWKAEKLKQKELEKQKAKPPFVPVGKPRQSSEQTRQQSSFVPKNHVFRPPSGLKDRILKEADQQSIYIPMHIPPKNKTSNGSKLINSRDSNDFKSKSAANGVTVGRNVLVTKSFTTNAQNRVSGNESKETHTTASLGAVAGIDNENNPTKGSGVSLEKNCLSNVTERGPNVLGKRCGSISRNQLGAKPKDMLSLNTATKSGRTVLPASKVNDTTNKTDIASGQSHNIGTCVENKKTLTKVENVKNIAGNTCPLLNENQKVITNKISQVSIPYMQSTKKGIVGSKSYCTTNKIDIGQMSKDVAVPVPSSSNRLQKESGIHVKPTTTKSKETISTDRLKPKPINVARKVESYVKPNLVKPLKGCTNGVTTAGAVGKIKAINELKRNTATHSSKPRLAANLKAKKQNNGCKLTTSIATKIANNMVSGETPSEIANSEKVFAFVTSTQMKKKSTLTLSTLDFSELCTTISPVELNNAEVPHSKTEHSVSAKRALLQEHPKEKKTTQKRKFNFVKKVAIDDTILDSTVLPPITTRHKEENVESEQELQGLSSASQKDGNISKTPQNGSIASRVLTKLQLEVLGKAPKVQSPGKSRIAAVRISKGKLNLTTEEIKDNPLNFDLPVKVDPTEEGSMGKISQQTPTDEPINDDPTRIISAQQVTPTRKAEYSERPINYLSPFVSVSRGKVSSRKEKEKRNSIYLQETPTKCQVLSENVEIPVENRRTLEAVRYFQQQLTDETQRLLELCNQWCTYKENQMELLQANGGEDMINATIGQIRLLLTKKFMQFSGLIDRCEAHAKGTDLTDDGSEATKTIIPQDLEGFWSMLGLQVENIEKRVRNLERWKANGWEDPDAIIVKPRPKKKLIDVSKKIVKTNCTAKPRDNSALRQMIRKKMAEKRTKNDELTNTTESKEIQILVKEHSPINSSHQLRPSITKNRTLGCNRISNTPGRMNIIVPNRRSRSIARTIISVPSPGQCSPLSLKASKTMLRRELTNLQELTDNSNLLKTALIRRSIRSDNKTPLKEANSPLPLRNMPMNSTPSTPATTVQNVRKSILKTPGTGRSRLRNVIFSDHLNVEEFHSSSFDENEQNIGREAIQQIHINDFHNNRKSASDISPIEDTGHKLDERAYCLRNRKVKLRPSCEIEIPK